MHHPAPLRFVLATGNAHKAEEFARLFAEAGLSAEVMTAKAVGGMPQVDETAGTFAGNARLIGHFVDVKISSALPHSLRGEVVVSD